MRLMFIHDNIATTPMDFPEIPLNLISPSSVKQYLPTILVDVGDTVIVLELDCMFVMTETGWCQLAKE